MLLWLLAACASPEPAPTPGAPLPGDSGAAPLPSAYADAPACPAGVPPGEDPRLVRWPYLQHPTPGEMTVVWGGPDDATTGTLEWSADGETWAALEVAPTPLRINDSSAEVAVRMARFEARATGLPPGAAACYRVSIDGEEVAGGLTLRTAPAPDRTDAPVRLLVIGDFGADTEDQYAVRDAMLPYAERAHLLLTTGDNAYSDGDWDELHEYVFGVNEAILARVPALPTPGNHDYNTDSARPYLDNFVLPRNAWRAADAERYWSLDWAGVHLIGLDSEDSAFAMTASADDDQGDWLAADLAATAQPWKIALWHKPAYSGHPTRGPDPWALLQFVPALEAGGVQLALQGHDHFYNRFESLRQNTPTPTSEGGITYLVTAGGGRGLYDIGPEDHQVVIERKHHFLWVEIAGCTLSIEAIGTDGAAFDAVTLDRCG